MMLRFVTSIKKKYRDRLINREHQWPYCEGEKLISLDLIKGERGQRKSNHYIMGSHLIKKQGDEEKILDLVKRTPIAYKDLFHVEGKRKSVRKILVEGDAGIGKTTLCTKFSEDWADEKLFQQFQLLLLLPLRERKVANVKSILDLLTLFHLSQDVCSPVAKLMEEEEGENVLLVADGWDELALVQRDTNSFLYKLLFGEIFPFLSVVLTSRYSASVSLHDLPCIDRFIEIRGFNRENIADFIKSEFADDHEKGCNLQRQLENSPLIGSVCSVPLCCVIVCHLWRTLQHALPTTMTELYTKITLNIIIRNIRKSLLSNKDTMTLSNFDSIPDELKQSWDLLCEFALSTLKRRQIVFSRDELVSFWPHGSILDENVLSFGLLQGVQSLLGVGSGMSFHFLHLTFHEYLAALYLSKQPLEMQKQVCSDYAETGRFDMVVRFLFGIIVQTPGKGEIIDELLTVINHQYSPWTICHSIFEAGHTNLTPVEDSELLTNQYYQRNDAFTAHDFSALIHVLKHTHVYNSVVICFVDCGIASQQISAFAHVLSTKAGKLQIGRLNMSGNKLADDDISTLFSFETAAAFELLTYLVLENNEITAEGLESIMTIVLMGDLTFLNLSHNPLEITGVQVLERSICNGVFSNLTHLSLRGTFTTDADTNTALLISLSTSLSRFCPVLTKLDVSENDFGVAGVRAINTVISQLTQHENDSFSIFSLDLTNTKFFHGSSFNFIQKDVSPDIQKKCRAVHLNLSDNPIGLEGIIALGKILLSNNNCISAISLECCQLTSSISSTPTVECQSINSLPCVSVNSITSQLCTIMPSFSIARLCVNGNAFNGKKVDILAGLMKLCPLLSELRCKNCELESIDIINLLIQLSDTKSSPLIFDELKFWFLDENKIDDDGIAALIEYSSSLFPSLINIEIQNNAVSTYMMQRLNYTIEKVLQPIQIV